MFFSDTDECMANTSNCDASIGSCTDTIGSYACGCVAGYRLDADGFTCNGMVKFWLNFVKKIAVMQI